MATKAELERLLFKYGHHTDCHGQGDCYCGWEGIRRDLEKARPDLVAEEKVHQAEREAYWKAAEERQERAQLAKLQAKYKNIQ